MGDQANSSDQASLTINVDGTYSGLPYSSSSENGQVYLSLNDLGISNDGEDMVLIAADENMDMETLESLIASGAVTAISGEGGAEYLQLENKTGCDGAQFIELSADQMHFFDPSTKTYYEAPGFVQENGGLVTLSGEHSFPIMYRCPSCPAMYSNANAFTKHMREKHFVKVYTCRQCEEFFETLSQLFLHARRCHVDSKKPKRVRSNYKFHCDLCNYMTNNGGTMEHHKRAHTGEKPYICDVCSKRFAQKANMKTHRNRHLYRDKIFRCDTCIKAFSAYDIYLAHLRTREHELREHFAMMASSQLALECLGCSLTFDSIYNLNKHTRSCRIVKTLQTKFRCLPCDAYVSDVASLKAHVKAHEGSQIISCPVCGERGFPGFNQLNHHITRAHALKVNRRHVCRYCESTFEMKKDLDIHIRSMHAEERNARQSRGAVGRLKCRYNNCEFTTNSILLLDRHHDQHRRQLEDGENDSPLPPARYTSANPRRHQSNNLKSYGETHDSSYVVEEQDDDYDVNDEIDDNLTPINDGSDITRSTIKLIKSSCKPLEESITVSIGRKDNPECMKTSTLRLKPIIRNFTRSRRLPAWYKDYNTEYANCEKNALCDQKMDTLLPTGIELDDSDEINADIPTEEWNIVVYDDEEEEVDEPNCRSISQKKQDTATAIVQSSNIDELE